MRGGWTSASLRKPLPHPARAVESPKIAIAVIAENGGHGGATAAPIARQVMDYYLGEILGMFPLEPVEPAEPAADGVPPAEIQEAGD